MKKVFKSSSKNIALLVVLAFCLFLAFRNLWSHPSDEFLIKNFKKNQAVFSHLVEMIKEDEGLERVDEDWTRPEDLSYIRASSNRIANYRELLEKIGTSRGFYSFRNPTKIDFIVSTKGLGISGSSKGYAYLENRPDLVVENLDNDQAVDGSSYTAYRPITGHWYLFYDVEN